MTITTLSGRELNQDVTRAKKANKSGPAIITDRGKPAHVLLSFADHQRLTRQRRNIAHALAMLGAAGIEFEPPRATMGAGLHVPDKSGERDALIAAMARVHGMRVVTRSEADLKSTGVSIVNPWESSP